MEIPELCCHEEMLSLLFSSMDVFLVEGGIECQGLGYAMVSSPMSRAARTTTWHGKGSKQAQGLGEVIQKRRPSRVFLFNQCG